MTAKNKIILSIVAIITTLVVAGSMVFIIFAATRGTVGGNITLTINPTGQIYGRLETRYTTNEITAFGNGEEGDTLIKTSDGKDAFEFNGWQDTESNYSLQDVSIELTLENPWVIFGVKLSTDKQTGGWWHHYGIKLTDETVCDDTIEVVAFSVYNFNGAITPESLTAAAGVDGIYDLKTTEISAWGNIGEPEWGTDDQWNYYMIRITDTSQSASFTGGFVVTVRADY